MNSYWENFRQTGTVTDYLSYINSMRQAVEEESDAANNNGDSSEGSKDW